MECRLYKFCTIFNPVFTVRNIDNSNKRMRKFEELKDLISGTEVQEVLFNRDADETNEPQRLAEASNSEQSRRNGATSSPALDPLMYIPPDIDRNFLKFPFLTDKKTFCYINKGSVKVMFIMRGLSGSGKSSIVETIKSVYSDKAVVCSADHYFHQPDGSYKFDEKLLSIAHSTCQHKAKEACQNSVPVVIIDNTNVRIWEMKTYLAQSSQSNYVVVLVEPQTPWKWDPRELASRNKHNVPVEILQRKVNSFDEAKPLYYGWFVNEKKSRALVDLCSRLFIECLAKIPDLKADMLQELGVKWDVDEATADGILARYFSTEARPSRLLHCTARYCGRGNVPGSIAYAKRADVQSACGKAFKLTLAGVLITKKTLSLRVRLDQEMSSLYEKPEENDWDNRKSSLLAMASPRSDRNNRYSGLDLGMRLEEISLLKGKHAKKAQATLKRDKKEARRQQRLARNDSDDDEPCDQDDTYNKGVEDNSNNSSVIDSCSSSLQELSLEDSRLRPRVTPLDHFFPEVRYSGFSRSAHVTVKTACKVQAKETNFDVLQVCDIESAHKYSDSSFVSVERGKACYYGDGICCVYFEKPLRVKTLFSANY